MNQQNRTSSKKLTAYKPRSKYNINWKNLLRNMGGLQATLPKKGKALEFTTEEISI